MGFESMNENYIEPQESIRTDLKVTERFLDIKDEDSLLKKLSETIKKKENKIGFGKNAEVFAIEHKGDFSELCVKKINKFPEIKYNDARMEAEIQMKADKLGVRSPRYVMALRDETTRQDYIVMELIKGVSLEEALMRGSGKTFPKDYDHKKFFDELGAMVDKLHENNIHHRDLHSGNVMINEENKPVILDYGIATYSHGMGGADEKEIYRDEGRKLIDAKKGLYQTVQLVLPQDKLKVQQLRKDIMIDLLN